MAIFKRGRKYSYHFEFNGQHIQRSTKQGNPKVARQMEAAHRTALAKGEVGIKPKAVVPVLEEFVARVMAEIRKKSAEHPRTAEFYEDAFNRALAFQPLAKARLDQINPELLSRFTTHALKTDISPATVNRSLAAVRRALYLAHDWELIGRVPKFQMLPGERQREFVLTGEVRDKFIAGLPEPSRTISRFLLNTGLRIGECCALTWDRVSLEKDHAYIYVDRGKTKNARRYIPLTAEARKILERQREISKSKYVFVRFGERVRKELWYTQPVSRHTVSSQFSARRDEMALPWDAVLHSTRHTALTDLGAAGADAFTIRAIAGHASVTTSQRYVHPVPETIARAIENMERLRNKNSIEDKQEPSPDKQQVPATVSATVPPGLSEVNVSA